MDQITTIKEQVQRALAGTNDTLDNLICFYQKQLDGKEGPLVRCAFDDLPDDKYDAGWGGTKGPRFIGFSDRYVYVSVQYDGSEWIEPIPRHPEFVGNCIPWPGG